MVFPINWSHCFGVLLSATCGLGLFVDPTYAQSTLWGKNGADWQRDSILPEWAFVGYQRGDRPLPEPEPEVSVADFGAVGDGETDCTEAFQKAIAEAAGKAIGIPEGTYVISDRLQLFDSGTALLGEGMEKTILLFTRGLQEIEPVSATTGSGMETTGWSWSGGIITLGKSSGAGGSRQTGVTSEAKRGESSFEVEDSSAFKPGDAGLVRVTDTAELTLLDYMYRSRTGDVSSIQKNTFSISQPVTVTEVSGNRITVEQRLRFDLREEWNPIFSPYANQSQEIGIADFTIRFPERPYRGHWLEDGMNGFEIQGVNNWARNIRIQNCDSGAFVTGAWSTVDGLVIESERKEHDSGNTGHHGISVRGRECLMTNFTINTRFFHDITVSSGSFGNVISKGKGIDLSLDHHRASPYENLFTEIDLGAGTRVWNSGGTGGKGLHSASGATFWNVDSKSRFELPDEEFAPPGTIFVGINSETVRSSQLPEGWHYEKFRPEKIDPPNLHLAQVELRKNADASAGGNELEFQEWINSDGMKIEARFHGLAADGVNLEMRDGRRFVYPLPKLNAESQALAKRLAK